MCSYRLGCQLMVQKVTMQKRTSPAGEVRVIGEPDRALPRAHHLERRPVERLHVQVAPPASALTDALQPHRPSVLFTH